MELLGFFIKNYFCSLEAAVAPALAELAASSGSVPRPSGTGRFLPYPAGISPLEGGRGEAAGAGVGSGGRGTFG